MQVPASKANHSLIIARVYVVMLLLPAGCPSGSHMINEIMWEQKCNDLTFQDFSNKWAQSTLKLIQGGVQWKKPASFEESSSVFFQPHLTFKGLPEMVIHLRVVCWRYMTVSSYSKCDETAYYILIFCCILVALCVSHLLCQCYSGVLPAFCVQQ